MAKTEDPIRLFQEWFEQAQKSEPDIADAVALATADASGRPNVRMVLNKGADDAGFVFYTNCESQKGEELKVNPQAALCFHWKTLRKQVRVQGPVTPVSEEEADAYFQTRAREARIGAWASMQSRPLTGRFELEKAVARYAARYAIGSIPRPTFWSGFRLAPDRIEFWENRPHRLHDRTLFEREGDGWRISKLYP